MSGKFTEYKLEETFIELLAQEGYPHTIGKSLTRKEESVLLERIFHIIRVSIRALIKAGIGTQAI